jgi:hypothetical protein
MGSLMMLNAAGAHVGEFLANIMGNMIAHNP